MKKLLIILFVPTMVLTSCATQLVVQQTEPIQSNDVASLIEVYFDSASTEIDLYGKVSLFKMKDLLLLYPDLKLNIVGCATEKEGGKEVALERANVVKQNLLSGAGVDIINSEVRLPTSYRIISTEGCLNGPMSYYCVKFEAVPDTTTRKVLALQN